MSIVINLFLATSLCLGLPLSFFFATAKHSPETTSEQLGHVDFPNSCKAEAQPALLKGLGCCIRFSIGNQRVLSRRARTWTRIVR
jgi:hypothetical protein